MEVYWGSRSIAPLILIFDARRGQVSTIRVGLFTHVETNSGIQ